MGYVQDSALRDIDKDIINFKIFRGRTGADMPRLPTC